MNFHLSSHYFPFLSILDVLFMASFIFSYLSGYSAPSSEMQRNSGWFTLCWSDKSPWLLSPTHVLVVSCLMAFGKPILIPIPPNNSTRFDVAFSIGISIFTSFYAAPFLLLQVKSAEVEIRRYPPHAPSTESSLSASPRFHLSALDSC
jgi:hypothetical protein